MSEPNSSEAELNATIEQAAKTEPAEALSTDKPIEATATGGPISLARIRELRKSQEQQLASQKSRGPRRDNRDRPPRAPASESTGPHDTDNRSASGAPSADGLATAASESSDTPSNDRGPGGKGGRRGRDRRPSKDANVGAFDPVGVAPRVEVPSRRQPLPQDLEAEIDAALQGDDLDRLLIGDSMLQLNASLDEGQRIQATVVKIHGEHVFVSLGGPNEGLIPKLQFEDQLPAIGAQLEVIVRGFLPQEGLYELTKPGNAISVSDWADLREGEVVEGVVTAANTGGLECKVGNVRGFIPASQVAEYRVENFAEFVGQKVLCVVTEANPRRGNLVLSRRAILEREKAEKRAQRLANLEPGAAVEGVVRKIADFGAFVDIGGLDGLLHVSQLSWERIKHPSEILTEGQKIQVRVDKVDPQTGKISLSYRSLQDHPWANIESRFPVGSVVNGTVTRIAEFGAFVKLATGIEGLVHLSELAHHRVHRVANVVKEGQPVEVKILSVEPDKQRISLSLKAAQAAPVKEEAAEPVAEEPAREPVLPKHRGPLKGGFTRPSGGEHFGLKW